MDYNLAVDELYSIRAHKSILGLDRIKEALRSIGNPQDKLIVLHIAGTNGKGSTAAMLAKVLECEGYKAGLFTSPHIVDIRERFMINSSKIKEQKFAELYSNLKPLIKAHSLTYFEAITVMAIVYFCDHDVDYAVLEVGLGGRLDATNICRPILTIITNIGKDHTHILGHTYEQIAREKAGIIKPNTPIVTGANNVALKEIQKIASQNNAPLYQVEFNDIDYDLSLKGSYQKLNASTVLTAIKVLRESGISVSDASLKRGLESTFWPGRMETINGFILDCAHNAPAFKVIKEDIREDKKRKIAIIGILHDKNTEVMLESIEGLFEEIILTPVDNPRTSETKDLQNILSRLNQKTRIAQNVQDAINIAEEVSDGNTRIYLFGSCYLVSSARSILKIKHKDDK